MSMVKRLSASAAQPGAGREEALKNINDVVRMIVEEVIEDGQSLPDSPHDSVEVEEFPRNNPALRSLFWIRAIEYRGLRSLTARDIAALTQGGFCFVRQKGFPPALSPSRWPPRYCGTARRRRHVRHQTLKSMIERQAGWTQDDLNRLGILKK